MSDRIEHVPSIADAEHEYYEDDAIAPEAEGVGGLVLWLLAFAALILLPWATQLGRRDLGWFQEPWAWPLIVLLVALAGGAILPLRWLAARHAPGFGERSLTAFEGSGRTLVYSGAFLVYLVAVTWLGFTISSILFMQWIYWISGLRGGKWPWIALAVTLAIVLAFRVGLDIWFPLPPVMELFTPWVGNTLGAWL